MFENYIHFDVILVYEMIFVSSTNLNWKYKWSDVRTVNTFRWCN